MTTYGDFTQRGGSIRLQDVSENNLVVMDSSSGNVGVGTATPQAKLDVRGGDVFVDKQAMKNVDTDIVYAKGAYMDASAGEKYAPDSEFSSVVLKNGDILKFCNGEANIYRSSDGGYTWFAQTAPFSTGPGAQQFVVMSNGDIVGFTNQPGGNRVWKSIDGGYTWSNLVTNEDLPMINKNRVRYCVAILPDDTILMMGGEQSGTKLNDVWASFDGGYTWKLQTSSAEWSPRMQFNSCVYNGYIYVTGGFEGSENYYGITQRIPDMWRSADKGKTWELVAHKNDWLGSSALSVVPINGKLYINTTYTTKFSEGISEDGGFTWTMWTNTEDYTGIPQIGGNTPIIEYNGSIIITKSDSVFRSDDEGRSWYELTSNAGTSEAPINSVYFPFTKLHDGSLIMLKGNNAYKSIDNGNNWSLYSDIGFIAGNFSSIVQTKSGDILYVGNSTLARTTDDGKTWTLTPNFPDADGVKHNSTICLSDGTLILSRDVFGNEIASQDIFYSTDNGINWNKVGDAFDLNVNKASIMLVLSDDTVLLLSTNVNEVYQSTDKGNSWELIGYTTLNSYFRGTVTKNDTIIIHGGSNDNKINISYDKGYTWTEITTSLPTRNGFGMVSFENEIVIFYGRQSTAGSSEMINSVIKIPLQSIEDFRTTGISHLAYDLNAGTLRESGVKLEDKYLKKQGTNVVNGEMILKGGNVRLERPVDPLPMSEPELRYPPDLSGATLVDGTVIDGTTDVSTDINNPTQVVVSGQPYGNGTYGFVCGNMNTGAGRSIFNVFSSGVEANAGSTSSNINPFGDNINNFYGLVLGIYHPKPTIINKFLLQSIYTLSPDRFASNIIIRASNSLEISSFITLATIDTSSTADDTLKTFTFSNNQYYKYYFYTFNNNNTTNPLSINIFHPYGHSDTLGLQYPPQALTGNTTTITGERYGNGVYDVNGSSLFDATYNYYGAFSNTVAWNSENNTFNSSGEAILHNFTYMNGSTSTTISGEWLTIEMPEQTQIQNYRISGRADITAQFPRDFYLFGSNNNSSWYIVDQVTDETSWVLGEIKTFSCNTANYYKYYAFVATKTQPTGDNGRVFIAELQLFGLPTLDKLYRFPPRGLTDNLDTIEGEAYGNGVYEASVSSTQGSYTAYGLFNYTTSTSEQKLSWSCADKNYTSDSTIGTYIGSKSLGDISGEYAMLQFPSRTIINTYRFAGTSFTRSTPSEWYVLGSNDGTKWNILSSESRTLFDDIMNTLIPIRSPGSYSYLAFVITKVGNENIDDTNETLKNTDYVVIQELELYGTPLESALIQSDANSQTLQLAPTASGKVVIGKAGVSNTANEPVLEVNGDGKFIGNVGIGTTNPSAKLEVDGNTLIQGDGNYRHLTIKSRSSNTSNQGNNGEGAYLRLEGQYHSGIMFDEESNEGIAFIRYNGSGIGAENYIAFGSHISTWVGEGGGLNYIPENGRVGIGTTNPGAKLDVNDNITGDSINRIHFLATTSGGYAGYGCRATSKTSGNIGGYQFFDDTTRVCQMRGGVNGSLFFDANMPTHNNAMVINHDGNVGIGTTGPGAKLDVSGGAKFTDNVLMEGPTLNNYIRARIAGTNDYTDLTGYGLRFYRVSSYLWPDTDDTHYLLIGSTAVRWREITYWTSSKHRFYTAQTERMQINSNGDVGINTTTPGAKLDVSGNAIIGGTTYPFTGSHIVYMDTSNHQVTIPADIGKIVSSTGDIPNISLDNAWPYIKLSSTPNDKGVFGVLNDGLTKSYGVNSVGEGALWVSDINGALENGDYITSSVIPGYGQRQDDDVLHNYTVAKITMDCDFTQPLKAKQVAKKEVHEYEEEEDMRDASGELVYETVNVLDASGNPVMETVQQVDASGELVYETVYITDASGNQVMETVQVLDASGNPVFDTVYVTDVSGNQVMETVNVLDASGEPVFDTVYVTDTSGNQVMETVHFVDEHGELVMDESGNYVTEDVSKTEQVPVMEDISKSTQVAVMEDISKTEQVPVMVEQSKTEERVKRVMVTKTEEREVLDENGKTVWVAEEDASGNPVMLPAYQMRYLLVDGTEISKEEYDEMTGIKYRAAFVGCTYHCG